MARHLLTETDFTADQVRELLVLARRLKGGRGDPAHRLLEGQSWGMIFFKHSTRTRVSFEVGLHELGAHPLVLDQSALQLSRGETVADTARVLSRYLHGLIIRCHEHRLLEEFARWGAVPVVNALSDFAHPCQIFSDLLTLAESWEAPKDDPLAALRGRKLAFFGDIGCNMANSWVLAGTLVGLEIVLCGPAAYRPGAALDAMLERHGLPRTYTVTEDPQAAATGADVLYTDVWVSMGMEAEKEARLREMAPFQVNAALLAAAHPRALFLHCLPAHAGEEVTQEVLDAPASVIFRQAENRLHAQKAILTLLAGRV